jgi:hypothetical protein
LKMAIHTNANLCPSQPFNPYKFPISPFCPSVF